MSIVKAIIASPAARTATETFIIESNANPNGVFIIDTTAGATVGDTLTITIDAYDQASRKYYNLITSAVIDSVETRILKIGMDFTAAANVAVKDFLPKKYRVVATKNNATSITYSIGANLKG